MVFVSAELTHEQRLEDYMSQVATQNQEIVELLKLLVLILEEQQPTETDISKAQE